MHKVYSLKGEDGKEYIGRTSEPLRIRLNKHFSAARCGGQTKVCQAIRKGGEWNMVLLEGNLTLDEASRLERHYIIERKTYTNNGLNMNVPWR